MNIDLSLYANIKYLFHTKNKITISYIKSCFPEENIDEIYKIIYYLLTRDRIIKRIDYIDKEEEYEILPEDIKGAIGTLNYDEYHQEKIKDTKLLLTSDLHFGNSNLESLPIVYSCINLAIENGVNRNIILGDFFDRKIASLSVDNLIIKLNKIKKIMPEPSEMLIHSLIGNHDELVNNNLKNIGSHIKNITPIIPSLRFFAKDELTTSINNLELHFSHRLFVNNMLKNYPIKSEFYIDHPELNELCYYAEIFWKYPPQYDLLIAGHLHGEIIKNDQYGRIYLNVPSTSKFNKGKTVAFLLEIKANKEVYLIKINESYQKVYLDETYKIDTKNKILKKIS